MSNDGVNGYYTGRFRFDLFPEGTTCSLTIVKPCFIWTEGWCYKRIPFPLHPELWEDEWFVLGKRHRNERTVWGNVLRLAYPIEFWEPRTESPVDCHGILKLSLQQREAILPGLPFNDMVMGLK